MDYRPSTKSRILVSAYACLANPGFRVPGGGDLMAWNIVTRLSRDCQVWVLTSALNAPAIEAALERQRPGHLHFYYVALPGWLQFLHRFPGGVQLYAYLWQWKALFAARKLHRRLQFDAFHHLTYENDWMASPAGALLPIPYLRGPGGGAHRTPSAFVRRYPLKGRLWERFRILGQWILRHDPFFILGQSRAKAILVGNHEALDAIPKKWRHKAQLFPLNGVPTEVLNGGTPRSHANGRFKVLAAGRLIRLKAFDLAIRAFGELAERVKSGAVPNGLELAIIGDGPECKRLESLIHGLGLDGLVRLEGWKPQEELWSRMRSCDVFLFPSLRDGGGLVVVEAMAAGKPVVCVDLGGPGMHVTPECGVKVKPETPEQVVSDLAAALETLCRDPELRERMGCAARKRAEHVYLWDRLAERLLEIY